MSTQAKKAVSASTQAGKPGTSLAPSRSSSAERAKGFPWAGLWRRDLASFHKLAAAGENGAAFIQGMSTHQARRLLRLRLIEVRLVDEQQIVVPRYYVAASVLSQWREYAAKNLRD